METVRRINPDLALAGQITLQQLHQIAQEGFQSVLNLRSPKEVGFLLNEQQQVETLGLFYTNTPIRMETINSETIVDLSHQINQLKKPALIHCDNGIRSAAVVLMQIAMRQGATPEQAMMQAEQLGLFTLLPH
jgi:uncharacterized protein (TIGR01244 family)